MRCSMVNVLKDRLKLAVKNDPEGRSDRAISMAATGKPDTIRDIYRGKVKNPRADTIAKLAKELNSTFYDLTGEPAPDILETPNGIVPVRVVGVVQAGAFMDPDEYNAYEHDSKYFAAVRDDNFPDLELIAFEVVGDSIDKECRSGGYALCVRFADTGLSPKNGLWVVAERQRGGLVERTIKQVRKNGRAYELHPSSTNPKHKPIRFPSSEPSEEVRIIALVRRFVSPPLQA